MYQTKVLKRFLIPASCASVLAGTPVAKEEEEPKQLIRPKDLPIYSPETSPKPVSYEQEVDPESTVMVVVRQVREATWTVFDQAKHASDQATNIFQTAMAHSAATIHTLREEENSVHRYGAVALSGLIGFVAGIRRGMFRRLVYTATGATAMAAICYPEEAKDLSAEGLRYTKRYIVIGYHFINGVLRDYAGVQLPALPGPLAIGSASAAEKDASTVPTSAALMPPPAASPSHISSGPIPMPPIDFPSSVSEPQKKTGKEETKKKQLTSSNSKTATQSSSMHDSASDKTEIPAKEGDENHDLYSRRT